MKLPKGFHIKRFHLHPGNSSNKQRHGHAYVTVSTIYDSDGEIVARGKSMCSKRDNPSRHLGRQIADGRAMKQFALLLADCS